MRVIRLLLLLLSLLAAQVAGADDAPLQKVSLQLEWKHQFEFAGFYAAKEKGYYQQVGLDVEFFEYDGKLDPTQEVTEGRKTFGLADSEIIIQRLRGVPVVLLSNYFKRSPLAIVAKPDIRLPNDLKGKRFMVAPKDINGVGFATLFRQFGLSKTDMTVVPHSFDVQDFIYGKVDAMSAYLTNEIFEIQQAGAPYSVIDPNNYGNEVYGLTLFADEAYAHANPELMDAFKQASDRGWTYALDHPEEIIDLILRDYNTQNKSRAALQFEAQETTRLMLPKVYPVGSIDPGKLRRTAEVVIQAGEAPSLDRLAGMIFGSTDKAAYAKPAVKLYLSDTERAFLKAHPIIRVSNELDWPPYDFFENGSPRGYSVDLMKLLADRIGVKIEFVQGKTWVELVDWFCAGKIDLLHPADKPRKLLDCASFSPPIVQDSNQFVTRRDHPAINRIADLFGSVAASPKGWEQTELLKKRFGDKFRIIETVNIEEAIDAVARGRADFTTDFANVLSYYITRQGYTNLKVHGVWSQEDKGEDFKALYIATRKDWPVFQGILDKALASLTPGELQELQAKWFGVLATPEVKRVVLSADQEAYLRRKGQIRMCVDPDWMPVERITQDGLHQGMAADVITRLSQILGINIVLVPTKTWQESLDLAKARQCDILAAALETPSRKEFMDFTTPYLSFRSVIVTNTHQVFIADFESVLGETFGITKGYALVEILKSRYPNIRLVEIANALDGFNQVQEGKLFGFIDALPTIAYLIQTHSFRNIKVAGQLEDQNLSWNLSVATRKDEPLLRDIFQIAIDALPEDQRQAIVNRWLSLRYEKIFDYVLMWKIVVGVVGVASLILWVVLVWNRRLARLNRELNLARVRIAEQNTGLEQRVAERTAALERANAGLRQAMSQLVQSEKLAALGNLVAGIAHELNTPIGNAVMLASTLADQERGFSAQMATGLSRSALQRFVESVRENSDILQRSLQRAAELISSFKQVAVDQASYQRRGFALDEVVQEIALALKPRLRRSVATLEVSIAADLRLDSFPGPLGQVLMNLIQNALIHAFDGRDAGRIRIESVPAGPGRIGLRVSDDGNGIAPAHLSRIFDPFFTTRLGQGGSGLGLHIVYNLVTGLLGGVIEARSVPGHGAAFLLELPLIAPQAKGVLDERQHTIPE